MEMRGSTDPHVWGTAPDFVGPRHALRERVLLRAFLDARPGPRVLNVGAGQGTFTNRLQVEGFELTSTDVTPEAVAVLRARVAGRVEAADATDLPFESGAFDAVVLGEVLEHIEDDAAALGEAWRVLASAGVLAVSVPRNPAWFSKSDEWAGHFRRYSRERLVKVVEAAGFEQVACVAWGFPMSALYHRTVYELAVRRGVVTSGGGAARRSLPLLSALLALDRLFVGWERGALGYVLVARRGA
jgi:SAM-dependent methyltransferase